MRLVNGLMVLLFCFTFCNAFLSEFAGSVPKRACIASSSTLSMSSSSNNSNNSTNALSQVDLLRRQAQDLREQADFMRASIQEQARIKQQRELAKIDGWIDQLLVNFTIDERTTILNTPDYIAQILTDQRFSPDQVLKIFRRMIKDDPQRAGESELIQLLCEAACKVDCVDREQQKNKRWREGVETDLQKRIFALKWGIDLDQPLNAGD